MDVLPAGVVVSIFSQLPFRDHVAATHVCKSWREISHEHPAILWSRFRVVNSESGSRTLKDILARSQHPKTGHWVAVDLHILMDYRHGFHAFAAIAEHMHHIRSLTILPAQYSPIIHDAALKIRVAVLLRLAPLLEHFELDFTEVVDGDELNASAEKISWVRSINWCDLDPLGNELVPSDSATNFTLKPWMMVPAELFAGQAPRLHSLSLVGGFAILHDYPALVNLRTLSIELGTAGLPDYARHSAVLEQSIESIARLPALQQLTVTLSPTTTMDFAAFALKKPVALVLKEMQILTAGDSTLLLCYFNYDHVEALCTSMYVGWQFEWRARGAPTTLQITFLPSSPEDYEWRFATADSRVWTLYSISIEFREIAPRALEQLAQNLKVLSVPAAQLQQFSGLCFAQLEQLRILLVIGVEWLEGGVIGVEQGFKMECPLLAQLEMVCFAVLDDVQITTEDVVTFVNHNLGISKDRLEHIDLWSMGDCGMEETADTLRAQYGTAVVTMHSGVPQDIVAPRSFGSGGGAYAWDLDYDDEDEEE